MLVKLYAIVVPHSIPGHGEGNRTVEEVIALKLTRLAAEESIGEGLPSTAYIKKMIADKSSGLYGDGT